MSKLVVWVTFTAIREILLLCAGFGGPAQRQVKISVENNCCLAFALYQALS